MTEGAQVFSGLTVAKNGQAASVRSDVHTPGELVTLQVGDGTIDGGTVTTLVDLNADVLDGIELGEVEELWFTAPDGITQPGLAGEAGGLRS